MPRLGPKPSRKICKILSRNGFEKVRQTGSHIVMQARKRDEFGQMETITVVVPDQSEIPVGTIKSIINHSKLSRNLFE